MSEQETEGDGLKKRRVYRCKFCDLDYTIRNDWKRHILNIHGVKAYSCLQCSELFYNEENLTDHMKTIHNGKTRHFCKLCSRSYKTEKQLLIHIDYKHKIEDPAECEKCGQEFHNTVAYKMHLQLHHKPHHVYYKCKKCHRSFRVPHYLKLHKQFDHNPDGKKMILDFLKKKNVDILTTDGVKCKSCKITFKSGVDLIRHLKLSHVKKVKKFACCKCKDAVYLSRASLGIHMRYDHGMLNHSCKSCPPVQKPTKSAPLKPKPVKAKSMVNVISKQKNKGNRSQTDGSLFNLINVGKNLSNMKLNKNIAQSEAPWAGRFIKENLPSDLENIDEQQLQNLLRNIKTAFNIMCTVAPSRLKASATTHLSSSTRSNILVKDVNSMNSDLHESSHPVSSATLDVSVQDPKKQLIPLKSSDRPNISADISSSDSDSRIDKSGTDANANNDKALNITLISTQDKQVKVKIATETSTSHSVSSKVLCHPKKRKRNDQERTETFLYSDNIITDTEKDKETAVNENTNATNLQNTLSAVSCHPKKRKLNKGLVEKEEKTVSNDQSRIKSKKEKIKEDVKSDKTNNESTVSETDTNSLTSEFKIHRPQFFRIPKITVRDFSKDMPKINAVNKNARHINIPKPAEESELFRANVTDEKENSVNKNIQPIDSSSTDMDYTVEEIEAFLNNATSSITFNDESTLNVGVLTSLKSQSTTVVKSDITSNSRSSSSTEVKSNIKIKKTLKALHKKTKLEDSASINVKSTTKDIKSLKTSKVKDYVKESERSSSTPKIKLSSKFKVKSYEDLNKKAQSKSNDNKTIKTSLLESSFVQTILPQEPTEVPQKLQNYMLDKSNQKASTSKVSSSGSTESSRQKYKSSKKHETSEDSNKDAKLKLVSSLVNIPTINEKSVSELMSHTLENINKKASTSKVLSSGNKTCSRQKHESSEKQKTYDDSKKNKKMKSVSSKDNLSTINDKSVSKSMSHTLDENHKKSSISKVSSSGNKESSRQKHKSSEKHKIQDTTKDENMKFVSSQENLLKINDKSVSKPISHTLDKNNKKTSTSKVRSSGNKESSRHKLKSSKKQKRYDNSKKYEKMKTLSSQENISNINDESVSTLISLKKLVGNDTNKAIMIESPTATVKSFKSESKSYSNERNKSRRHKGEEIKDKSSRQNKKVSGNSASPILKLANKKQSSDNTNDEIIIKSSVQNETLVVNDALKSNKKRREKKNKHRSCDKNKEKSTSQENNMSIANDNVDSILELSIKKHYSNEKNVGTINSQHSDKKESSLATGNLSLTLKTSNKREKSEDNKNKDIYKSDTNKEIIILPMQSVTNEVCKRTCDKKKDIHNSPSSQTEKSDATENKKQNIEVVDIKSLPLQEESAAAPKSGTSDATENKKQNIEVVDIKSLPLQEESAAAPKSGTVVRSKKETSHNFEKGIILVTKTAPVANSPCEIHVKRDTKFTPSSSQEEIPLCVPESTPISKIQNKNQNFENADINMTEKQTMNKTPENSDIQDSQNISSTTPAITLQLEKFTSPEISGTPISTTGDVMIKVLSPSKKVYTASVSNTSMLKSPKAAVTCRPIIHLPKTCKRTIFISKDMIMKANPLSSKVSSKKEITLLGMKKAMLSPIMKLIPEAVSNDNAIPMSANQAEQSHSSEIGTLKEADISEEVTVEEQSEAILENHNENDKTCQSSDEIIVDNMEVGACNTNTSDIKTEDGVKISHVKPQKERSKPKSRKRVNSEDKTADENKMKTNLECTEQIKSMKDVKVLLHRVDQVLNYRKEVNKLCLMSTSDKEAKQEGPIKSNTVEVSYEDGIPDDDYHLSVDDTFCLQESQLADVQYDDIGMNMIEVANYVDIVTSDSPTPSKTISPVTVTVTTTNKEYVCPFCHLKCDDQLFLLNHLTEIHGNDDESNTTLYKCGTCGSGFRLKDTLDRHVRVEHTTMNNFNCDHCKAVFFYKIHLKQHIKYEHATTANKCDICMEEFKSTIDLNDHSCGPLQQKNILKYEQPVHISEKTSIESSVHEPEMKKFSTNEQGNFIEVEKLSIYEPEITLKVDETPRKRVRFSNNENEQIVRKVTRKVKKSYKCEICNVNFQSGLLLFNHNRLLHKLTHIFKCATCSVQFLSQANLQRHTCKTDIKFECKKCKLIFGSRDTWVEHKKQTHNMGTLKCDYCYKYFKTNQNLVKHTTLKHLKNSDFVNMVDVPNKPQKKSHKLQARMTSNIYDDLKIINEASEETSSSFSAKQVIKTSRRHICNICKSMFNSEKDLLLHSKIHKLHRRLYTCLKCMRKFPQKLSLLKHIKSVHKIETNKIYRCRKCKAVFKFRDKLIQHNKLKHSRKQNAALHLIMKKRRLSSPNKSLMRLDDELTPIGASTPKNKPVITSELILTPQMLRAEMFRCKECGAYLPSEDSLQRHMQWEHLKMHKCGHCELVLPTAEEFLKHLMSGHANEKIKEVLPTAQIGLVSENRLKWKTQLVHNYSRQGD